MKTSANGRGPIPAIVARAILSMLLSAARGAVAWKTRPAAIRDALTRLSPGIAARDSTANRVRVAAVQWRITLAATVADYVTEMDAIVRESASLGATVVAFPENNGLALLGLIPGVKRLARAALSQPGRKNADNSCDPPGPARESDSWRSSDSTQEFRAPRESDSWRPPDSVQEPRSPHSPDSPQKSALVSPLDVFRMMSPFVDRVARTVFSELAKRHRMVIMAGSFLVADGEGNVCNTAYLFDETGRLMGTQDKLHLVEAESTWGLAPGRTLTAFSTPFGTLAAPVCMDATYFETFRILLSLGVDIALLPIGDAAEYRAFYALRGIWPRVQESPMYGVKAALVGNLFGQTFTGKAGVVAPISLTPQQNGVLAEAKTYDRSEIVVADLDIQRLHTYREQEWEDNDIRPSLYERDLSELYARMQLEVELASPGQP